MPPHTSPHLTSSGDAATGGRHRRQDSADSSETMAWARPRPALLEPSLRSAVDSAGGAPTRSARHRAGDTGSYSAVRTAEGGTRAARARHSSKLAAAKQSEAKQSGAKRSNAQRAATGTHRAPNTMPLESWLAAAKTRPTTVLGTLVVAGLLITAVPLSQPSASDPGALTAAVQAAASAQAAQRDKAATGGGGKQKNETPDQPATGGTTEPTPEATVTARPVENNPARTVPAGAGPGRSLLTTGSQKVALTFDDGPDPVLTPKILAMLDQYQIKATFCLVGSQALKHPELVRQIVAAGHTLCNHTFDHDLRIGKKSAAKIRADLEKTNQAIRAAVPDAQIPFFRAPGGNFSDKLVSVAYADGMASLYWEVDPRDWEHLEGETDAAHIKRVISLVKQGTKPGAIILSHDFNQPDTIAAYQELLPWLVENFELGVPSGTGETPVTPPRTEPTKPTPTPSTSASTQPADSLAPPANPPTSPTVTP